MPSADVLPTSGDHLAQVDRHQWNLYASHRRIVMELLEPLGGSFGRRICVLGAGHCDDVELPRLLDVFGEVHLVDINQQSLDSAAAFQRVENRSNLRLHGGIDLTGITSRLMQWSTLPATSAMIDVFLKQAGDVAAPNIGTGFDVVVSTCVLTQLIDAVVRSLGLSHPATLPLILTVRDRHVRLMNQMLGAGGIGVLISDVVSSDTLPQLLLPLTIQPSVLLQDLIATKNFFTGVNPFVLMSMLSQIGDDVMLVSPWVWTIEEDRSYLVYAITFHAKSGDHQANRSVCNELPVSIQDKAPEGQSN